MQATQQRMMVQQKPRDEEIVQVIQEQEMGGARLSSSNTQDGIPLSQSSVADEYCPVHSDLFVAFDNKKKELVCNQCIYNEVEDVQKALEQLTFTSYVASSLKDLFDEKFAAYKSSLQDMNKIAPKVISQTLESQVNKFFFSIDAQITEVESAVLTKIQSSTNLRELETLLCREKEGFGLELEKLYEQSRIEIENFVQKGCYSSVVSKKDQYEELITKMRGNNDNMQRTVEEGQRRIERILTIKQQHETETTIGKRLHEIVDSCLEIDLTQANAYKRQRIEGQDDATEALRRQQQQVQTQRRLEEEAERKRIQDAENERLVKLQREQEERAMREAEEQTRRQQEQERQRQEAENQRIAMQQEELRKQQEDAELKRRLEAEAERERLAEIQRQQEQARQQELARQQEQARQQELARQQEQARQQEVARQQELSRQQELARQQEQARQQELARQQEQARQQELALQQEQTRQQEYARQQELSRQAEAERQRVALEQQRQQEQEREAAEAAEKKKIQEEMQRQAEMANRLQMQQLLENQKRNTGHSFKTVLQHSVDAQREASTATQKIVARGFLDRNLHRGSSSSSENVTVVQQQQSVERVSEEIVIHDSTVSDAVHDSQSLVQDHPHHYSMQIQEPAAAPSQMVDIVDSHHGRDDDHHQMFELNQIPQQKETEPVQQHANSELQQVQNIVDQQIPAMQQMVDVSQSMSAASVQPEQHQVPQQNQPMAAESAPQMATMQEQQKPAPLVVGPNTYGAFVKQSANRVTKCVPDETLTFRQDFEGATMLDHFMYRAVTLPNGRTFVVGGSKDVHGAQATKSTHEIVDGKLEEKAQMWIARSAFGLAVYPNFSQIFIAGGKINENEATKHCERYIVAQNVWKRLPELREPKFNTTLCFFNNGGTLYCFGGLTQQGSSQLQPSASIERLSKGQNSWQLLDLRMPKAMFDMGALQINATEVLIFGGFEQGSRSDVLIYTTGPEDGKFRESKALETADFFEQNGVYIKLATDSSDHSRFIFNGHLHNHLFDSQTMEFKTLPMQ